MKLKLKIRQEIENDRNSGSKRFRVNKCVPSNSWFHTSICSDHLNFVMQHTSGSVSDSKLVMSLEIYFHRREPLWWSTTFFFFALDIFLEHLSTRHYTSHDIWMRSSHIFIWDYPRFRRLHFSAEHQYFQDLAQETVCSKLKNVDDNCNSLYLAKIAPSLLCQTSPNCNVFRYASVCFCPVSHSMFELIFISRSLPPATTPLLVPFRPSLSPSVFLPHFSVPNFWQPALPRLLPRSFRPPSLPPSPSLVLPSLSLPSRNPSSLLHTLSFHHRLTLRYSSVPSSFHPTFSFLPHPHHHLAPCRQSHLSILLSTVVPCINLSRVLDLTSLHQGWRSHVLLWEHLHLTTLVLYLVCRVLSTL